MHEVVEREVELDCNLDQAWEAITSPDWLSDWLAEEVELECRPGGAISTRSEDERKEGWVETFEPPEPDAGTDGRLVFWWADGDQPSSRVELVLSPADTGRSRLRVVESRPLELLDLVGIPTGDQGQSSFGPMLVAA